MEIEHRHKPWLMTTQDDYHPVLSHCLVERVDDDHGILFAANGFEIGIFPAILTPEDVVGLVPARLIKAAKGGKIGLEAEWFVMPDEGRYPRRDVGQYPDCHKIIDPCLANLTNGAAFYNFGITPALMRLLIDATGLSPLCFHFGTPEHQAMLITGSTRPEVIRLGEPLDEPFAVLMPIRNLRKVPFEPRESGKGQFREGVA